MKTANGTDYDRETTYFYFDVVGLQVREIKGLRVVDDQYVGSMGIPVVKISDLHADRVSAIEAGEQHFVNEIRKLKDHIRDLEDQKPANRRSMRFVLMARE